MRAAAAAAAVATAAKLAGDCIRCVENAASSLLMQYATLLA